MIKIFIQQFNKQMMIPYTNTKKLSAYNFLRNK